MLTTKKTNKNKISTYSELCKFIRETYKTSEVLKLTKKETTRRSLTLIEDLSEDCKGLINVINGKGSNRFILLSSVVSQNTKSFHTSKVTELKNKKEFDNGINLYDSFRCLKTYLAAFGVVFSHNGRRSESLFTESHEIRESNPLPFLVDDFPIGGLIPVSDYLRGKMGSMIDDLDEVGTLGIDYLFDCNTGKYISPVHYNIALISDNLRMGSDTFPCPPEDEDVPNVVFIGGGIHSPAFGFGRGFSKKLYENLIYSSNGYGMVGQSIIKNNYENAEELKKIQTEKGTSRGTIFDTEFYGEKLKENTNCEQQFNPPSSYIPSVDHFIKTEKSTVCGKTLKTLTMKDVVKIYDEEELKILMLAIGRSLIGVPGSSEYMNPDYTIDHDWRKFILTTGAPKIGKSTVVERIAQAMNICGFTTCAAIDLGERFNLGKTALADLSFFDDLTEDRLIKTLTSATFKSFISGGKINVEDKGKDKQEISPRALLIGNINNFSPEALYAIDNGAKDRFVAISASGVELKQNPYYRSKRIAEEWGLPMEAVWVRILRDCLDYTLKFCSISGKKPRLGMSIDSKIRRIALNNKTYFDSEPGITFLITGMTLESIKRGGFHKILKQLEEGIRENSLFIDSILGLHEFTEGDYTEDPIYLALVEHWNAPSNATSNHPLLGLRELRAKSLTKAKAEISSIMTDSSFNPNDLDESHIEEIIKLCKNQNGGIRKTYTSIKRDWTTIVNERSYRNQIKEVTDYVLQKI